MPDESLKVYRDELLTLMYKSQDMFEKQLSYISAGSLALSMGFIKDIIKDIHKATERWSLNLGWFFLGLTLLLNLISHIVASKQFGAIIKDIDENCYAQPTAFKRINRISILNMVSIGFLVLGIFSIIYFTSINI